MSEAHYHKSYVPPSSMEEMKLLPLRDYTFYQFNWFLPEGMSHYEAFKKVSNLVLMTPEHTSQGLTPDNDFLVRVFAELGNSFTLPEEYYLYPDTIGKVENTLTNLRNAPHGTLALDVYVKNVQDTHRVYRFSFMSEKDSIATPLPKVAVEIYECTSSNVVLPGSGTRDVHILFRIASQFQPVKIETDTSTVDVTAAIVYYNDDEKPQVVKYYWSAGNCILRECHVLPEDKFPVLNQCVRHSR